MTTPTTLHTAIPTPSGTLWLTGWREPKNGLARFNLTLDTGTGFLIGFEKSCKTLLRNASWLEAWEALVGLVKPDRVEATLRSVLPTP